MKQLGIVGAAVLALGLVLAPQQAWAWTHDGQTTVNGRLGVFTETPQRDVSVWKAGTGDVRFRLRNDEGIIDMYTDNGNYAVVMNGITQFICRSNGRIGLGLYGAAQKLHIKDDIAGIVRTRMENSEGYVDFGTNDGNLYMWTGDSYRMTILADGKVGIGVTNPAEVLDVAGNGKFSGSMAVTGPLSVTDEASVQVLEITGGSDISEQFDVGTGSQSRDLEVVPGMVVCIDVVNPGQLVVSEKAYDRTVAGIVSGAGGVNTGMVMGQAGSVAHGDHPVALTGRVFCEVDATTSAVVPGDLLTTSGTPGHAMKVQDYAQAQGAIIGKAMTPLAKGEKGLVLVLVTLQ